MAAVPKLAIVISYIIDLEGDTEIYTWPSFYLPILKTQVKKAVFCFTWFPNACPQTSTGPWQFSTVLEKNEKDKVD